MSSSGKTKELNPDEHHDLRPVWPFSFLVAGPSCSGKTTLITRFLTNAERTMRRIPRKIVIYCSYDQPAYKQLRDRAPCPVIVRKEPLPDDLETEDGSLLLVDDLQATHAQALSRWFTVKRHHLNTSVIYVVQNVFDKTPHHRTISLNASHIVLFKNPRDSSQVSHLSKQVSPRDPSFVSRAYALFTEKIPHSYIVMDFHQTTPEQYRLRDSLLPYVDFPTHVYADARFEDGEAQRLSAELD